MLQKIKTKDFVDIIFCMTSPVDANRIYGRRINEALEASSKSCLLIELVGNGLANLVVNITVWCNIQMLHPLGFKNKEINSSMSSGVISNSFWRNRFNFWFDSLA